MIINKPMINQSYTYKLIVLDTETGEEKEFLPIHIKEFQLKVYPNKNLLDDDIWNFIWDVSNMNRKSKLVPMTEEEEYRNAGITKEEIKKNKKSAYDMTDQEVITKEEIKDILEGNYNK